MRLHDIALASIKRRKARVAFVLAVIGLGVATIVALLTLTRTMQREVGDAYREVPAAVKKHPASRRDYCAEVGWRLNQPV